MGTAVRLIYQAARVLAASVLCCALLPPAAAAQQTWRYVIERGDTLIAIARRHLLAESHWRDVQRLNRVADPYRLQPGATLLIPLPITRVQAVPARLVAVSGAVEMIRAGAKELARNGAMLQAGDELVSGVDSNASIEFGDGSQARLMSGSHIKLAQMQRLGQSNTYTTEIEIKQGRVESTVKPQPRGAQNYLIRTPTVNLGVRGTEFRAAAESAETTRAEVLQGLVAAANPAGQVSVAAGFGTVVKHNQAPEAPRKLLPAPDLTALAGILAERLPIRFDWPALSGAQGYRVQVARDATFAEIISEHVFDKAEAKLARDIGDGTFAVRVRAIDAGGLEGSDAIGQLRVKAHPLPPLSQQPAHKSIVRGELAQFRWTQSDEAARYRVQVSSAADFGKLLLDASALEATGTSATLAPGEYFWRVASIRADSDQGPFGQASQFTLKPQPQLAPGSADAGKLTFAWGEPEAGQQFHFQLAHNRGFSPIVIDRRLSAGTIDVPRPVGGELFMRIRVIEADGSEGAFGPIQSFVAPPHELNITYALTPRLLSLRWPAVLQPGWKYQWQLARDAAFTDLLHDEIGQSSIPNVPRPSQGSYYARARVLDDSGAAGEYAAVTRVDVPTQYPWCCAP